MDKPHKKLDAWKLAMELVKTVYKATADFPAVEKYSLTDQIRRAAVSVPSNIAEGAARQTKKEFANFLHIAQGSLSELDTQLELARELGYLSVESWNTLDALLIRVDKMLTGLIRSLLSRRTDPTPNAARLTAPNPSRLTASNPSRLTASNPSRLTASNPSRLTASNALRLTASHD